MLILIKKHFFKLKGSFYEIQAGSIAVHYQI